MLTFGTNRPPGQSGLNMRNNSKDEAKKMTSASFLNIDLDRRGGRMVSGTMGTASTNYRPELDDEPPPGLLT